MMSGILILAQQTLDFFQVIREGLWELYLWFLHTIRTGRIVWALVVVAGIIIYYRFFKK